MCFRLPIDMAAWGKNMTALGYGYDSVGLRIRLRRLMETYPSACRDICVSRLSYLSQLIKYVPMQ